MPAPPATRRPELLSKQVSDAAYFFLNLHPSLRASCVISAGGRERCNPDYLIHRRTYGYTVLECVVAGRGSARLDGIKFPLSAGSIFAYRPDTPCEIHTDPTDRLVKYFLCLSGRTAGARLARAGVRPGRATRLLAWSDVQALFEQLIREGQVRTPLSSAICAAQFEVLLLKIRESQSHRPRRQQPGRDQFLRLKAAIDAEAGRLRSLQEIAGRTGLSPSTACKLFRQHMGLSPFRYLMRRKMEIAAQYLLQTGGLVKEAAAHVGFADPYHFSRRFKHAHGLSPRAIRARHNE